MEYSLPTRRVFIFFFFLVSYLSFNSARAQAPSIPASDLSFTNVTTTPMTVNWLNGNGANRIVVAREGADPDTDPSDFTSYTADPNFGDGSEIGTGNFVVYNSNGNTVDITGLTPEETYHVMVYEYNGAASLENYNVNTATDNPASQLTEALSIDYTDLPLSSSNMFRNSTVPPMYYIDLS